MRYTAADYEAWAEHDINAAAKFREDSRYFLARAQVYATLALAASQFLEPPRQYPRPERGV
jgi:hypothetical protein